MSYSSSPNRRRLNTYEICDELFLEAGYFQQHSAMTCSYSTTRKFHEHRPTCQHRYSWKRSFLACGDERSISLVLIYLMMSTAAPRNFMTAKWVFHHSSRLGSLFLQSSRNFIDAETTGNISNVLSMLPIDDELLKTSKCYSTESISTVRTISRTRNL
jgi:hypothetical protein